jgi:hypothetical protein
MPARRDGQSQVYPVFLLLNYLQPGVLMRPPGTSSFLGPVLHFDQV